MTKRFMKRSIALMMAMIFSLTALLNGLGNTFASTKTGDESKAKIGDVAYATLRAVARGAHIQHKTLNDTTSYVSYFDIMLNDSVTWCCQFDTRVNSGEKYKMVAYKNSGIADYAARENFLKSALGFSVKVDKKFKNNDDIHYQGYMIAQLATWRILKVKKSNLKVSSLQSDAFKEDIDGLATYMYGRYSSLLVDLKSTKAKSKISLKDYKKAVRAMVKQIFTDGKDGADKNDFSLYAWKNQTNGSHQSLISVNPVYYEEYDGRIRLYKAGKESGLAIKGCTFSIYEDGDTSKDTVKGKAIATMTTNAKGVATSKKLDLGTKKKKVFYVKETKVPEGYTLNKNVFKVTVKDGEIAVVKDGEPVYNGETYITLNITKSCNTNKKAAISTATFSLLEWDNNVKDYVPCMSKLLYSGGKYTSGKLYYTQLNKGKFRVIELDSGDDKIQPVVKTVGGSTWKKNSKGRYYKDFNLNDGNSSHELNWSVTNDCPELTYNLVKKDKDTNVQLKGSSLKGVVYTAYQWNKNTKKYVKYKNLTLNTTTNTFSFKAFYDTINEGNWKVVEESGPSDGIYTNYTSMGTKWYETFIVQDSRTINAECLEARNGGIVVVNKVDALTGSSEELSGSGTLGGARYGVYIQETVDGMFNKGDKVGVITIDGDTQKGGIDGLPIAKYMIKEETASTGYELDPNEHSIDLRTATAQNNMIKLEVTSQEPPETAPVEIIKKDAADANRLLEGAGFTFYKYSEVTVDDEGEYDLSKASPVVVGENGETEIFTDKNGYLKTIDLPYDKYLAVETTVPQADASLDYVYKAAEPVVVSTEVEGDSFNTYEVNDPVEYIRRPVKLTKVDKENADIKLKGAGFTFYDISKLEEKDGKYLLNDDARIVIGNNGETELFTNEQGILTTKSIDFGKYLVVETTVPDAPDNADYHYTACDPIEIEVDGQTQAPFEVTAKDDRFYNRPLEVDKVDALKEDIKLEGAGFTLYDISKLEKKDGEYVLKDDARIVIGSNGETQLFTDHAGKLQTVPLEYGTYLLVETTLPLAPDGAWYSYLQAKPIPITIDGDGTQRTAVQYTVKDDRHYDKRSIALEKNDLENTDIKLKGAGFTFYDVTKLEKGEDGKYILNDAAKVPMGNGKTEIFTDDNGLCETPPLALGKYYVVETTVPKAPADANYVYVAVEPFEIEVTENTKEEPYQLNISDPRDIIKRKVTLFKVDAETKEALSGAGFTFYDASKLEYDEEKEEYIFNDDAIVDMGDGKTELVTDENGNLETIYLAFGTYIVKESTVPETGENSRFHYKEIDPFAVVVSGKIEQPVELTVENVRSYTHGHIQIEKVDARNPEVKLEGAGFSVYDKSKMTYDEEKGTYNFPDDAKVAITEDGKTEIFTNEDGIAKTDLVIPFGDYVVKETTVPTVDESLPYVYAECKPIEVTIDNEDGIAYEIVAEDDIIPTKRPVKIEKRDEEKPDVLLKGAGFTFYDTSKLTYDEEKEEYILNDDAKVVITEDGKTEIFTDGNGAAQTIPLAFNSYLVVETTVPDSTTVFYEACEPMIVKVEGDVLDAIEIGIFDPHFKAEVHVTKKDSSGGAIVAQEGTQFKIKNVTTGEFVTTEKDGTKVDVFETNKDGICILPERLVFGTYEVVEVKAPKGFALSKETVVFTINKKDCTTVNGIPVYNVDFENEPLEAEFYKTDITTGAEVIGAHLQVIKEDTQDVVDEWVSEKEPHKIRYMEAGTYILRETQAPTQDGYVKAEDVKFEITADGNVLTKVEMKDDYTKLIISKRDISSGEQLDGATLVIYKQNEDGTRGDEYTRFITKAGEDHKIEYIPVGKYILVEQQAPFGYSIAEEIPFEVTQTGVTQAVVMYDDYLRGNIEVTKVEEDTGSDGIAPVYLKGAEFDVYDEDGETVSHLVTDAKGYAKSEDFVLAHYSAGKFTSYRTFTIREVVTPKGYATAPDRNIQFSFDEKGITQVENVDDTQIDTQNINTENVSDDFEIGEYLEQTADIKNSGTTDNNTQNTENSYLAKEGILDTTANTLTYHTNIEDAKAHGIISFVKTGELPYSVSYSESEFGDVSNFQFKQGPLGGVVFTIYSDSECTKEVESVMTDNKGLAFSGELEFGTYYVKETSTLPGYVLDKNVYTVEVQQGNSTNKLVYVPFDLLNKAVEVKLNILKLGEIMTIEDKEKGGYNFDKAEPLEGVSFGIYTAQNFTDSDGNALIMKDTLVGVVTTDKDGVGTCRTTLLGGSYYFKELKTVDDYALDEEEHPFVIELANDKVEEIQLNNGEPVYNYLKKTTKVTLCKQDKATGDVLPDVEFELYTKKNELLGTYVTDSQGLIVVNDLPYGDYYFVETRSQEQYILTKVAIPFTINSETEVNLMLSAFNTRIVLPKLGFADAKLVASLGMVAAGFAGMVATTIIAVKSGKKRKPSETVQENTKAE